MYVPGEAKFETVKLHVGMMFPFESSGQAPDAGTVVPMMLLGVLENVTFPSAGLKPLPVIVTI